MKKNDNVFFSLFRSFKDSVITEPMVSLGNLIELPVLFKKLGWRLAAASFPRIVKFNGRLRQGGNFGVKLLRLSRDNGPVYVVKYLKSSQLAVSKAIAGNPFKSLRELEPDLPLPRLTSSGLPRVIPLADRRAILSGSSSVIRWWMTLFGLYRIIQIPGKIKLDTITAPFSGSSEALCRASLDLGALALRFKKDYRWAKISPERGLLWPETSSPNYKVSWLGLVSDAHRLDEAGMSESVLCLIDAFWDKNDRLKRMYQHIICFKDHFPPNDAYLKDSVSLPGGTVLGSLATKLEAAGKVRVFAMVDVWTQTVLKPLHDSISEILRSIPNDGTFDQGGAVKRCFAKAQVYGCSFGYDLSAATDRLPIVLQESILVSLFGAPVAASWKQLLVGRPYMFSDEDTTRMLRYSVGQPMGALSSFNMLALTHHLIVQRCHAMVYPTRGGTWYEGYELLGDDIVIFDSLVAERYLSFMIGIGLEINVKKSVVARNETFEFAKVTGHKGINVSAVSWRMFISQNSFIGRANIAFSLLQKGIVPKGWVPWFKHLVRHRRYTQGSFNLSLAAVWSMFAGSRKLGLDEFLRSLMSRTRGLGKMKQVVLEDLRAEYILTQMSLILSGAERTPDLGLEALWKQTWPYLKAVKLTTIRRYWDKYFDTYEVTQGHVIQLTEEILSLVVRDWVTPPAGAEGYFGWNYPMYTEDAVAKGELWWDVHDSVEDLIMGCRAKLDKIGITPIDLLVMEDLDAAVKAAEGLDSVMAMATRAREKITVGSTLEPKFSMAVDAISWLHAARRLRRSKVDMTWFSTSWDVWMSS